MPRTNLRMPLVALLAALTCLGLLGAAPAQGAPLEQVAHFGGVLTPPAKPGVFPEEEQLGGVGGMAVNYTGAGGVPAGTVYAATAVGSMRIAMFKPIAGGLKFSLGWEVTKVEGPYERCGPDLEPTPTECPTRSDGGQGWVDVDIDQSTGNVYVINGEIDAGLKSVAVYTPKGEEVLTRFGETIKFGPTTAATPDKVHSSHQPGGIAVNEAGEVYLYDRNGFDNNYERLMKFVPKVPDVYDEYEYAGAAEDVAAGEETHPTQPAADAAGNLYTTPVLGNTIKAYDPANPEDPPLCEYKAPKDGITTITVNPLSGELYYFSFKKELGFAFKTVHQLDSCDPETGKFGDGKQVTQVEVTPERADLGGLAFDPLRKFSPSRGAGVLYGGAPGAVPSGTGKGEPGLGSLGYIYAPPEENPPAVKAESVSHVTTTSALLHTSIDPEGSATSYVFQYIAEAAYEANEPTERFAGAQEAPLGGAPLGEGSNAISAAAPIAGLSPDTFYRFRAVATSNCSSSDEEKVCEGSGEALSFHTFAIEAPGLPDHRAYELVSPVQKNGGQVLPADPGIDSCFAECKPGNLYTQFPRQSAPAGNAIAYEGSPFGSEGAPVENQYIAHRDAASGWLTTNLSPQQGGNYQAFDTELNQGVLRNGFALSPEAPPGYLNLYSQPTADPLAFLPLLVAQPPNRLSGNFQIRYAGTSADLSRVFFEANDALSEETPFAPAATDGGPDKFNLYEWERATGELRLVNVAPGNAASEPGASFGTGSAHAISEDGSRAFWSDEAGQLYVREDGEVTREIPGSGKFLSAATDGSKVLLDDGQLYDLEAEETFDLTGGKGGFQGLVGQSEDLSRVYFVDTAVLDEVPNGEGDEAEAGKFNLYAWSEGSARFIATLLATDNTNGALGADWNASPANRTAQASPDGRRVAFLSQARLTGYDNTGPCELVGETQKYIDGPCQEVFLYDSQTDKLRCPSCNPSGSAPLGRSVLRLIAASSSPQLPYLTDSGRLYFDSQDSLTPFDSNEGVEDVYEYEPNGVGTCKRPEGCVSLISPGSGSSDSNLLTIDESGKNVFFTTRDQLTLPDKDELIDLYVARENGGIPGETAKTGGECQGEACQPAAFAPNDPTPGSSSFEGPGNVKQGKPKPRCPKGRRQVKRKGKTRCVKRQAKRHSARTANRNRGGAK